MAVLSSSYLSYRSNMIVIVFLPFPFSQISMSALIIPVRKQYIMINCFLDAKVTFEQLLYFLGEYSACAIAKVVADTYDIGLLQQLFIKTFKTQFKQVVTKVVVTRGIRLHGCLPVSFLEIRSP